MQSVWHRNQSVLTYHQLHWWIICSFLINRYLCLYVNIFMGKARTLNTESQCSRNSPSMSSIKDVGLEKGVIFKDGLPEKEVEVVDLVPDWQPSKEQQNKVLRKIDLLLIPLLCGCVLCMSITSSDRKSKCLIKYCSTLPFF